MSCRSQESAEDGWHRHLVERAGIAMLARQRSLAVLTDVDESLAGGTQLIEVFLEAAHLLFDSATILGGLVDF